MQICTALFCQNYVSQTCTSLCFEFFSFLEQFSIVECHVRKILEVCLLCLQGADVPGDVLFCATPISLEPGFL
jgi:hypothetical protein